MVAALAEPVLDESNSWPFALPDDNFNGDALLDLRYLNETKSGESGFIRLSEDGNDFVLGDGKPIRFWAVGNRRPSLRAGANGGALPVVGQTRSKPLPTACDGL